MAHTYLRAAGTKCGAARLAGLALTATLFGALNMAWAAEVSPEKIGWSLIDPGGGGYVSSIEVDPNNDNVVYASTNVSGIKVSKDAGASWQMITPPREEYAKYGLSIQQINDRMAIHPKRPGMLLFSTKSKRFPSIIYAYTESEKRFQVVYRSNKDEGDFGPFSFDPYDSMGDTVYTAAGDIHFVDGSNYDHRFLGERAKRGFVEPPGTLILGLHYDPAKKQWETKRLYESTERIHIYSIAVRKADQNARKEFFFTTNKGLFRAELDEQATGRGPQIVNFRQWQPSPIFPAAIDVAGGKAVYDPRNKHFYISLLTTKAPQPDRRRLAGGLFVSTDDGNTWVKANQGSAVLDQSTYYYDIGLHPQKPEIVYVGMRYDLFKRRDEGTFLYRSSDGGQTWENIWDDKNGFDWGWIVFGQKGRQPNRVKKPRVAVGFVSVGKEKVYATTECGQIFVKDNPVKKWRQITTKMTKDGGWISTGFGAIAVPFSVGIDPNNSENRFILYGDFAFFQTKAGKEGLFLVGDEREYQSTYAGHVAVNKNNSNIIYFGSRGPHRALQQGEVIRGDLSLPPDERWMFIAGCHHKGKNCFNEHGLTRGPLTSLFIDYSNAGEDIYVTKYLDRPDGTPSTSPGDPPGVYVLKDVERSIRKGNWQWQMISKDMALPLCMRPIEGFSKLIVGTGKKEHWQQRGVGRIYILERKQDGMWTQKEIFVGNGPHGKDIAVVNDIDFCETDKMIYFATEKGVFKIDLNGDKLQPVWGEGRVEVTSLEVNTKWPNIMYMSSEFAGAYRSTDYGKTWTDLSNELGIRSIHMLELDSANDRLYVITSNNGIWTKSFKAGS